MSCKYFKIKNTHFQTKCKHHSKSVSKCNVLITLEFFAILRKISTEAVRKYIPMDKS